jgi:hypothetical protein
MILLKLTPSFDRPGMPSSWLAKIMTGSSTHQTRSVYPFLKNYLWQCAEIGIPEAPLEQEVVRIASEVCGKWENLN